MLATTKASKQVTHPDLIEFARALTADAVSKDRSKMISILRSNGIQLPDNISKDNLTRAVIVATKDSQPVRQSLFKYYTNVISANTPHSSGFLNEDGSSNSTSGNSAWQNTFVGSILTPDRIGSVVDTALGVWATSMNTKAATSGNDSAVEVEKAKTDALNAQAAANATVPKKSSWAVPVVITLVVLGAGIGIYFAVKKHKKKAS